MTAQPWQVEAGLSNDTRWQRSDLFPKYADAAQAADDVADWLRHVQHSDLLRYRLVNSDTAEVVHLDEHGQTVPAGPPQDDDGIVPPWPERALLDNDKHVVWVDEPRPIRSLSLHARLWADPTAELPALSGAGGWDVGAA